jgi:hypothetical protein
MFMHFVRSVLKIHPQRRPNVSYFLDTFDSTVKFPVGAIWRHIKTVVQIKQVSRYFRHINGAMTICRHACCHLLVRY